MLIGQNNNSKKITLIEYNKDIELIEKPGFKHFLLITQHDQELKKTIELDSNVIGSYRFQTKIFGERSFVIISGHSKLYIFNIHSDKIIGPLTATWRGEGCGTDAQSGMWYAFEIIQNGQYLLAYAIDCGLYCYDLRDLYHPKEVEFYKSGSNYSHEGAGNYTFIDLRKENIYNVITASCNNFETEITYNILLYGLRFQQDSAKQLDKDIIDDRYLILRQIKPDSAIKKIIIDLQSGLILEGQNHKDLIDRFRIN